MSTEPSTTNSAGRELAIPVALLLPVVLALAAGAAAFFSGGLFRLPAQSFYGTAAQIIPILIVAFAVERRASALYSDRRTKVYRTLLFAFLCVGELCALLGASGAIRGDISAGSWEFKTGLVAETEFLSNVIAGGTAAGLVGGFVMTAVVALGGPGWLSVSWGFSSTQEEPDSDTEDPGRVA